MKSLQYISLKTCLILNTLIEAVTSYGVDFLATLIDMTAKAQAYWILVESRRFIQQNLIYTDGWKNYSQTESDDAGVTLEYVLNKWVVTNTEVLENTGLKMPSKTIKQVKTMLYCHEEARYIMDHSKRSYDDSNA